MFKPTAYTLPKNLETHKDACQLVEYINYTFPPDKRFGWLLTALLDHADENKRMGLKKITKILSQDPYNIKISKSDISLISCNKMHPTYDFVEALAVKNALKLPPGLLREDSPLRVALFAFAHEFNGTEKGFGYVEVTPDSSRKWCADVLASHERLYDNNKDGLRPSWGDLMRKLLSHTCQGERITLNMVAKDIGLTAKRNSLHDALHNYRALPEETRIALYDYLKLDREQQVYIEARLPSNMCAKSLEIPPNHKDHLGNPVAGRIPLLTREQKVTPFSSRLEEILATLGEQGITQNAIAAQTKTDPNPPPASEIITSGALSEYKRGGHEMNIGALRRLVWVLKKYVRKVIIDASDITQLIEAHSEGLTAEKLNAESDSILRAGIAQKRPLHHILHDVLDAPDIWLSPAEMAGNERKIVCEVSANNVEVMIAPNRRNLPTPEKLEEVLRRCSAKRVHDGLRPYADSTIAAMVKLRNAEMKQRNILKSAVIDTEAPKPPPSISSKNRWTDSVRANAEFASHEMHADKVMFERKRAQFPPVKE